MKTKFLTITLAATMLCSLWSCGDSSSDDLGVPENPAPSTKTGEDNTTDVAVTGGVAELYLNAARVIGYVNLDDEIKLALGTALEVGIEVSPINDFSYPLKYKADQLIDGRKFFVEVDILSPGETYYYRTYVKTGTAPVYGKTLSFTTEDVSSLTLDVSVIPNRLFFTIPDKYKFNYDKLHADYVSGHCVISADRDELARAKEYGKNNPNEYLPNKFDVKYASWNPQKYRCEFKLDDVSWRDVDTDVYYYPEMLLGGKSVIGDIQSTRTMAANEYVSVTVTTTYNEYYWLGDYHEWEDSWNYVFSTKLATLFPNAKYGIYGAFDHGRWLDERFLYAEKVGKGDNTYAYSHSGVDGNYWSFKPFIEIDGEIIFLFPNSNYSGADAWWLNSDGHFFY